jgi:hypothetical protein
LNDVERLTPFFLSLLPCGSFATVDVRRYRAIHEQMELAIGDGAQSRRKPILQYLIFKLAFWAQRQPDARDLQLTWDRISVARNRSAPRAQRSATKIKVARARTIDPVYI